MKFFSSLFIFTLLLLMFSCTGNPDKTRIIAGCFTESGENGLNVFDFNASDGTLIFISAVNAGPNPSYLCRSEKRKIIYVVNEVTEYKGNRGGGLTALKYEDSFDKIEKLSDILVPAGGPCYISLTADEDFVLIANYESGSVAVVRLDRNGIPLSVCDTIIYKSGGGNLSHPHMIASDPSGERIYLTDLGLDRVMAYTMDKKNGQLVSDNSNGFPLPQGTGPRHFVFNKNGSIMYVIGELNSTVNVFTVNKKDGLDLIQTITTREKSDSVINYCADLHIGKSEKYLYGSNRGENSIATFLIMDDGKLRKVGNTDCGGNWPRNFVIAPDGKFLLVGNQKSDNISVFRIDETSGLAPKVTQSINLKGPGCLKF